MITPKTKPLLVVVLVILAAGTITTTTVQAANLGPFWHISSGKLGQGVSRAIVGKFEQPFSDELHGTIGTNPIRVQCEKVKLTGARIWNGTQHGESEGSGEVEGPCKLFINNVESSKCEQVAPLEIKNARAALWYHTAVQGTSTIRTETIQIAGTPGVGNLWAEQIIEAKAGQECVLEGKYKIEGSVAGEPQPQNILVKVGKVHFPTEQQKHIWQPTSQQLIETQLELKFNNKEATVQGQGEVELTNGEEFGVFKE